MSGMNKAIIIGHLGADPEMRYTQKGTPVCNFRVATSESWKDGDGQKQEKTEWHRICAWAKQAELCGQYLKKGRLVCVEGSLETRKWEDSNGVERYTTEIKAHRVTFLGGRNDAQDTPKSAEKPAATADDDIPF